MLLQDRLVAEVRNGVEVQVDDRTAVQAKLGDALDGGSSLVLTRPVVASRVMSETRVRPPFLISSESVEEKQAQYPNSDERLGFGRRLGRAAGLLNIGVHLVRLPPGHRTSWPHAEEKEDEFVYVLDGQVDAWVDGVLHPMQPGDFAAFPAGTGICHTFLNNGEREAKLLVGGEADKSDSRIYYPLHPQRRGDMPWSQWWEDVPKRPQGQHDGLPDAQRTAEAKGKKTDR